MPAGAVSSNSMMLSPVSPPSSLSAAERPGAMLNTEPPSGGTTKPFAFIVRSLPLFLAIVIPFVLRRNTSRRVREATDRATSSIWRLVEVGRRGSALTIRCRNGEFAAGRAN